MWELRWWVNASRRKERKLEKKEQKLEKFRSKTLLIITGFRSRVEEMAHRPRDGSDPLNSELLESVRKHLTDIEDAARLATSRSALRDLEESAGEQETFRAYLCPRGEVRIEGNLVIALLEWWGIPKSETESLRGLLVKELDRVDDDIERARCALHALYKESDEWAEYRDDYEEEMQKFAGRLFCAAISLPILSIFAIHYAFLYSPLLVCGLLCAGVAGGCVSVLTKLPALEEIRSEKIDSYARRIWSRISAGAIASLIGCGLLGWGLIPISVQGRTFADVLNSTVAGSPSTHVPNIALTTLILLAVTMLFGFSERALTSFERGFLSNSRKS